jgi:poly(3-hydroxybutyrate) depolymerase
MNAAGHLAGPGGPRLPNKAGRCAFGIESVTIGPRTIPVVEHELLVLDFAVLTEFVRTGARHRVLVVAPLAGAYPVILRDLVVGLLRHANVAITDWRDPCCVPAASGDFGLAENIAYVLAMMREMGPDTHVVGVCQGTIPALAATALLATMDVAAGPHSLTLMAGPVDPLVNPTRVVRAARGHSPEWFERRAMRTVPDGFAGKGRRIYPASAQLTTLTHYLARHWLFGEVFLKLWYDDGEDPVRFPFATLVTRLMNLPAELVLDMMRQVFVERALCTGRLAALGRPVLPGDITRTGLMTIEGENDDIAAPGQTYAAHGICTGIPDNLRRHLSVANTGHFSLFHGSRWRSTVLPALVQFFCDTEAARRTRPSAAKKARLAGEPPLAAT